MESHVFLFIFLSTHFLLLNHLSAHSLFHVHHHPGIPTNLTHHLHFQNFNPKSTNNFHQLKLLGNAAISQDHGFIQIPDPSPAGDQTYQAGRAIYSSPIRLFDPITVTPASFHTTFSFQFTTANNSNPGINLKGGNGLAFLIVPDEFTVGRPGPWLGILNDACDHYKAFAVEFDSSHDPSFGDPNDDHVGVNLGSVVSFKTANSSETNASLHGNSIHRAWIMYDGHRKWIDIYLGVDGNPIPSQPILSTPLNLSPYLKEYMFVGFSASTGDSPQIHNVLSWEFNSTVRALINVPLRHICHRNVAQQVSKYSTAKHRNRPSSFMIFMCVVGLCTVTFLNFYCYSMRSDTESSTALAFPDKKQRPLPPTQPRRFVILELYRATKRFSNMEVLASDSRGVLYRGTLPNGCNVAVKRFSNELPSLSRVDWTRVLKRISLLTHVCHPSLAPIRGWCCDNRETILVYDYFTNGSLDRWLFGMGVLPWTRRFKLIKQIAEALTFLGSKELSHGNLKSSSIFLDINYKAVLGDYGFVFYKENQYSGRIESISRKNADVFCFGMLILEIVAGKKTTKTEEQEMGVLEFAWSMHERGEKVKVIDERMASNVNLDEIVRVLEIGLVCSLDESNGRPSMEEVVQYLNIQKPIPRLPELLSRKSAICHNLGTNTTHQPVN
ncbi:probable L-type lectin-domain containing receptor kinase S.7 [Pistacia vera]|uniref:probable L-type lectin-domain containing receptor kinase S.7 n=1 Tax=Pistacia vera TaxID=55513 RepID=UPI00126323FB|nr:probable L-type lectin-domain containing receptor kinase S.7 [Pistacia vera]